MSILLIIDLVLSAFASAPAFAGVLDLLANPICHTIMHITVLQTAALLTLCVGGALADMPAMGQT